MLIVSVGRMIMLLSSIHIDTGEIEDNFRFYLEGHAQEVNSMCWDSDFERLASISNESTRKERFDKKWKKVQMGKLED
nr:hypothetical protein [Tanacetum cinerariifolium]